jgi:hypothetical protein
MPNGGGARRGSKSCLNDFRSLNVPNKHLQRLVRAISLRSAQTHRGDAQGGKPDLSDVEVRDILVHAMVDVGADPALVYAFQKTGVYVCDENEKRLPEKSLKAFDGAVDEYLAPIKRPPQ